MKKWKSWMFVCLYKMKGPVVPFLKKGRTDTLLFYFSVLMRHLMIPLSSLFRWTEKRRKGCGKLEQWWRKGIYICFHRWAYSTIILNLYCYSYFIIYLLVNSALCIEWVSAWFIFIDLSMTKVITCSEIHSSDQFVFKEYIDKVGMN